MKPTHSTHQASLRQRQIGRKVLQADRLARALNKTTHAPVQNTRRALFMQPRFAAGVCTALILVVVLASVATHFYTVQTASTQKATTAKLQSKLKAQSIAADACRRKKVEQKADLIGKVTYDELYDGNECDK